jgi:hypothetical protein
MRDIQKLANDPIFKNLMIERGLLPPDGEIAEEPPRVKGKPMSPKLHSLSEMLRHEHDDELRTVVAGRWRVTVCTYDESLRDIIDPESKQVVGTEHVGYVTAIAPIAVGQCMPDVLTHIKNQGIEGPVEITFTPSGVEGKQFIIETAIVPDTPAQPRPINPNAGLPEMMAMFMAQQEKQTQLMMAAFAKMTDKNTSTEQAWQRKLDEVQQRHAQQMQELLNRQAAQFQGDKRLQIGGTIEQGFLQAANMAVERTFSNMLNPQPAAVPQQVPAMGMTSPMQTLAQMVQGMKADQEAKQILARELPGLLGEGIKPPEPTLFEMAQQIIPMFMLLKNMNGKDPNQLESAMKMFSQMRGPGSQAAGVNPLTGMPIPDAAPQDGDAALAQLAQMSQG